MTRWLIAAADFVRTGGMDIANWHLARHLAQQHSVELLSHHVDDELTRTRNVTATIVKRPFGMNLLGEPKLRKAALARSKELLAQGGRVVANGGNCPTTDINWVHYVHAAFSPVTAGSLLRKWKVRYYHQRCLKTEKQAFEAARVIICNSRLSAKHVNENCGIPAGKCKVVYYGSDPGQLAPISEADRAEAKAMLNWDERPRAVFIGALADRRKGFDVLYDAWKLLCAEPGWDADLAVIGRGAELDSWRARAAGDGLAKRIEFLGFRKDVPKVLAGCDVMVHPARYEAYGLGVHEAVARGLPAVVSAEAGVSERLSGLEDLTLADPNDVKMLVSKLKLWRERSDYWRAVTAPLAETIRSHTWDDMSRSFLAAVAG